MSFSQLYSEKAYFSVFLDIISSLFRHNVVQSITSPASVNASSINSSSVQVNVTKGDLRHGSSRRKSRRRSSKKKKRSRSRRSRSRRPGSAPKPAGGRGGEGGSSSPSKPGSASPTPRLYSPRFGVFTGKDTPYNGSVEAVDRLEQQLGRKIDIVNWYQSWAASGDQWVTHVQPSVIAAVTNSSRSPTLTWEPWNPNNGTNQPEYSLSNLASGSYDDYITSWADALRDTGKEIYLRPMHEMNGGWYPWGDGVNGNTPQKYIDAWRHMHDIFERRGASNVKWVWCPSVPDEPNAKFEKFYPGDRYVDVLGMDGYNWGSTRPKNGGWKSFKEVFNEPYNRLMKLSPEKPIWINEVGSAPEGGSKSDWVSKMWDKASSMKSLEAIVWFDQKKEEDWRAGPVANAFAT